MTNCTDCRYQENMCKWPCDDCVKGDKWEEKPFTNADHIRAMMDEMLAYYITMLIDRNECILKNKGDSWLDWLNWLKQEVGELHICADVKPVLRARWVIGCDGYYPYCSNCRQKPQGRIMTDFCPNCGADMREG